MNNVHALEFSEPLWEDVYDIKLNPEKIRIFIAGDSTACNYPHTGNPNRYPRTGWGQVFGELFDENVQVVNCAISGRSSKSFMKEKNFKYICDNIAEGDLLIIQFAHNDSKESDKSRYTSPADGSYQKSIYQYINAARTKGATPILATPVTRNIASDDTLLPYSDALKAIGEKEGIAVLDIYELSHTHLLQSPEEHTLFHMVLEPRDKRFCGYKDYVNSEYYADGSKDNTHLNIDGARYISRLAADEIKRADLEIARYII